MNNDKAIIAASTLIGLELDNPLRQFVEETVDDGGDEPPEYVFVGSAGRGRVTAKQLIEFRYCEPAITAATGEVVDPIRPAEWRRVRRALLAARTFEKLDEQAGVTGTTRARLVAELRSYGGYYKDPDADRSHIEIGLRYGYPVYLDGRVWFSLEAMLERLDALRVRYVRRELTRGLLALGCGEKRIEYYYTSSDPQTRKRTSRTLYAVPTAVLDRAHRN